MADTEISVFLARFFGVILTVIYGSVLFNKSYYNHFLKDLQDQPVTFFITGFLSLMVGILTILLHNVWTPDWRGLVTFIEWLLFISGIIRLLFPKQVLNMLGYLFEYQHRYIVYIAATIMECIGLYLLYIGFFVYI